MVGGLLLAFRDPPRHETAFHQGAAGERAVAQSLERRIAKGGSVLLNDRRMPGGHGNIDHLAVAASGVYVIDAKSHKGKVEIATPLFGSPKLTIGRRDHTKLLDGLDRQVQAVKEKLAADFPHVPVNGVLCFTDADLPLFRTLTLRGHVLLHRKAVAKRLNAPGPIEAVKIKALAHALAGHFPPA